MGPWIETDADPASQHLRTRVNGNEEQNETTDHLLFDVPTMIEFITRYVTLEPGDCIFTGTPGTTQDMGRRRHLRDRHQRHRRAAQPDQAGVVETVRNRMEAHEPSRSVRETVRDEE